MKKTNLQFIQETAAQLKLTHAEKARIRARLECVVATTPARALHPLVRIFLWPRLIHRKVERIIPQFNRMKTIIVASLVIALLGGGTVSAAEKTVPGDALYPIKIHVNEKARAAVAVSAAAKAELRADIAARRLEEAEKLAAEGKLNAQTELELRTQFVQALKTFSQESAAVVASHDEKTAVKLNADFETKLRAHAKTMKKVIVKARVEGKTETEVEIKKIHAEVVAAVPVVVSAQAEAEERVVAKEDRVKVQAAAQGKLTAAENKIAVVQAQANGSAGNKTTTPEATAELQAATQLVVEGKAKLDAGDSTAAFSLFQQALIKAQAAHELLVTADADVDASASSSVRIAPPVRIRLPVR